MVAVLSKQGREYANHSDAVASLIETTVDAVKSVIPDRWSEIASRIDEVHWLRIAKGSSWALRGSVHSRLAMVVALALLLS